MFKQRFNWDAHTQVPTSLEGLIGVVHTNTRRIQEFYKITPERISRLIVNETNRLHFLRKENVPRKKL